MKKMMAALLVRMMVCGMSIGVCAATHVHNTSYMGHTVTETSNVGSHPYVINNGSTYETVTCYISAKTEAEVWKCACGYTEYKNAVTRTYHSVCGL